VKFKPYSFSKINTFKLCPKQFEHRYILKTKVPEKNRLPLIKGSALHHILEKYPNPPVQEYSFKFLKDLDEFFKSKYMDLFKLPNAREIKFGLDTALKPINYSKKALFRGFIDFIAFSDDTLILCDWKSGKYKDEVYQDFSQLIFYAIYIFKKYSKINTIKVMFIYVEHSKDNTIFLTRNNLEKYENLLKEDIHNIEQMKFPKKESVLCKYCDYKNICKPDLLYS